jgi:serine/threonine protein kinase
MIEKKSNKVKILDFGLASISSHDIFRSGSPKYMAPELQKEKGPYSNKTDVWSFGILAYETLTQGHFPFDFEKGESSKSFLLRVSLVTYNLEANKQVLMKKLSKETKKKVKEMDPKGLLADLIVKCLHGDPKKRPTMEEISLELRSIKQEYSESSSCTIC